jgi:hypothetical protein
MCAGWLIRVYIALHFEKEWTGGGGDKVEVSTSSGLVPTDHQTVAQMPMLRTQQCITHPTGS